VFDIVAMQRCDTEKEERGLMVENEADQLLS